MPTTGYPPSGGDAKGIRRSWPVVREMTRPILAYLVVVTLGAWVFYALEDVKQGGDLVRAAVGAATSLLGTGLGPLAFLTFLLIPAMVLSVELVHRFEAASRAARSALGAAAWAGWCLFIAITLAVASRVVIVVETLAGDLVLVAAAGAGFSLLAFDGHEARAGRAFILLALAVTAFVILGSIWMAGRWGSAA